MFASLKKLMGVCGLTLRAKSSAAARCQARSVRLGLETLEDRLVPTVTFGGGPVMPAVEIQAVYYGANWSTNLTLKSQAAYLDGFLNNIVHSSYMDMLSAAGYGVGRGSFSPGVFDPKTFATTTITDAQIQQELQLDIKNHLVQQPDANRLYVFYVQSNEIVSTSFGNSQTAFLGYHFDFAGTDALGAAHTIRYAVMPYPGGTVNNASLSFLSTLDTLTAVTSHELAEAVTDPNPNTGWNDATLGEIGDVVAHQDVHLNGYAVQRESDKNDQAMTPFGATGATQESFVLTTTGNLFKHTSAGLVQVAPPLAGLKFASLSDQTIDNEGQVMVDVVTTTGVAYEFHEGTSFGSGWVQLMSGATSVKASQGISYVRQSTGAVWEFKDKSAMTPFGQNFQAPAKLVVSNAASIDAGTDRFGVSSVDIVTTTGVAEEFSNSTGLHTITTGVKSISAGKGGISALVTTTGTAKLFSETTGALATMGTGVKQATIGTDAFGLDVLDLLFTTGVLTEQRGAVVRTVATGVNTIGKIHAGLLDVVFTTGVAEEFSLTGGIVLGSGASAAA